MALSNSMSYFRLAGRLFPSDCPVFLGMEMYLRRWEIRLNPLKVFLDTEFTDFFHPELISLGSFLVR